jgi:hypothetical protein
VESSSEEEVVEESEDEGSEVGGFGFDGGVSSEDDDYGI